jgi:hypothetical protein
MLHRVHICSNLKSSFAMQKYDQLEGCNCYNLVMSSFPSSVLEKKAKFQEEEHYWLRPTTYPPTKTRPRTVCCQEGEEDEDMTPMDVPTKYYLHNEISKNLLLSNVVTFNSLGTMMMMI